MTSRRVYGSKVAEKAKVKTKNWDGCVTQGIVFRPFLPFDWRQPGAVYSKIFAPSRPPICEIL